MKKFLVLFFILIFLLPSCAQADVKPKACPRSQVGQVKNNLECKKVSGKYRWMPTTVQQTLEPSKPIEKINTAKFADFNDSCDADPLVPQEWAEYQSFAMKHFSCSRFYRYINFNGQINNADFQNSTSSDNSLSCKPVNISNDRIDINNSANIQIIPIQFNDHKSNNNPKSDYEKYFNFVLSYYKNTSDTGSNIKFIVPDKYININKNFTDYNFKNNDSSRQFVYDSHRLTDNVIDFSQADMTMTVFPLTINPGSMIKFVSMLHVPTNEKVIKNTFISVPPVMIDASSWLGVEPMIWVLQIAHFAGLPDRFGDNRPLFAGHPGAGSWGITSRIGTDFLIWDRWSANMIYDNQIKCITNQKSFTQYIVASTIKGQHTKAVAIKIDDNKTIFIESIRPYGYNYKLPKHSHGALVYLVDAKDNTLGRGVTILNTEGKPRYINQFGFPTAPLKSGESLKYGQYNIIVMSSNETGDFVKVEKLGP